MPFFTHVRSLTGHAVLHTHVKSPTGNAILHTRQESDQACHFFTYLCGVWLDVPFFAHTLVWSQTRHAILVLLVHCGDCVHVITMGIVFLLLSWWLY